jgi:hypothetical protein
MTSTTPNIPTSAAMADVFIRAIHAVADGTADDTQRQLRDTLLTAFAETLDDPAVVAVVKTAAGSFTSINDTPWDELSPLGRWIREASAEADRSTPPLSDMEAFYKALVAASSSSGPGLRLGKGVNIVALDAENQRWLSPHVAPAALDAALHAPTRADAKMALRRKGAVLFHWSVERTFLVPSPDEAAEMLPLPAGGKYVVVYSGPADIVGKPKFRKALAELAKASPVADLLIWDTSVTPSTLWSLRGRLGHCAGDDIDGWPDQHADHAETLRNELWP